MTANRSVATVVRCAGLLRHVLPTLVSIERQRGGGGDIVLVTDPSTPTSARPWLEQLAADRGVSIAHATSATPGAVRNAGIRATRAPAIMCVDAGDSLNPVFHEAALAKLHEDRSIAIVTGPVQWLGPGAASHTTWPEGVDLAALTANTDAIHPASMFKREDWTDLDGFDERLEALDAYEFWMRVLARERRGSVAEAAVLIRPVREGALYRQAWDRERHVPAFAQIVKKHSTLFAADPSAVLYGREVRLRELASAYHDAVDRRDSAVRELESLKARAVDLRRSLPERDSIDFGDLHRTTPVARDWGYERGQPIDRYYIERFLEGHAADIQGVVLEVQEADYTKKFGGGRVLRSDVIDLDGSNPRATVTSDLRSASNIPSNVYDCVILTQTIHVIDDMRAVLAECARILKPGGVLLATLPSASRVCLEYGHDGDFWRVTEAGARKLFAEVFPSEATEVRAVGNVLSNAAFLYGIGTHELSTADLDASDPYFPLVVTVKARKPGVAPLPRARGSTDPLGAAILLYHRVGAPASDVHGLSVPVEEFRAQMAHLRDRYRPMPLCELADAARQGDVPDGAVAVTFDDGYIDNYTVASPILMEYGLPATFFLTTDRLGDDQEYWWDTLERILLSRSFSLADPLDLDLPGGRRRFAVGSREARVEAHGEIHSALAKSSAEDRDRVMHTLLTWSGQAATSAGPNRRLRPDEIVELAGRRNHSIGAHSVRHLMLPQQTPPVQREEISASRRTLETLLGHPIREFAYPYGAYDEHVVGEVRAAGFDVAVTCDEGAVPGKSECLRLPRREIPPGGSANFATWLRMSGTSSIVTKSNK